MSIQLESVKNIQPHAQNPRKISHNQLSKLKRKMIEFPQYIYENPIKIDENNVIISGNQRYKAALELGLSHVPVSMYTREKAEQNNALRGLKGLEPISYEEQCNEIVIADNAQFGEYDWEIASMEWDLGMIEDYGVSVPVERIQESKDIPREGEIVFSEELMLEHNYIVLYFDNALDWQAAIDKYKLKKVKTNAPKKSQKIGIGRVIKGKDYL